MDEQILEFIGITAASPQKAESYLRVADFDINQAVQLFFDMDGADMEAAPATAPATAPAVPQLPPRQEAGGSGHEPIDVGELEDDDLREAIIASDDVPRSTGVPGAAYEDDEAMARRLQEEAYRENGGAATDPDGVRAPIAKTRETLVGGDYDDDDNEEGGYNDRFRNILSRRGVFSGRIYIGLLTCAFQEALLVYLTNVQPSGTARLPKCRNMSVVVVTLKLPVEPQKALLSQPHLRRCTGRHLRLYTISRLTTLAKKQSTRRSGFW